MPLAVVKRICAGWTLVRRRSTEDLLRLIELLAPLPHLHHKRVPRLGGCAGAPVASDQQRVLIEIAAELLRAWQNKSRSQEFAGLEAEFAHGLSVFSTGRKP